jgi:uncharacterized membrane protein
VAVCFSISPIFIRGGLDEMNSPLLGVTIGMALSAIAYAIILLLRRERLNLSQVPRESLFYQLAAGLFVGSSTWLRWLALSMAPVAVVLTLGRVNVPVVIILSIFLVGQKEERVTNRVWLGATLIVAGSLMLIFVRLKKISDHHKTIYVEYCSRSRRPYLCKRKDRYPSYM